MSEKVIKIVWTRQGRKALNTILDYRYKDIPNARRIVRKDIISSSKQIVYSKQYSQDEIYPQYRKIIVRDYKILYKPLNQIAYIMNVVCTLVRTDSN